LAESLEAKPQRTLREQREIHGIYEDVLRQAPNRHDIRRRQAKVALTLGRYGDAIEHINRLLTEASAEDSELEHLLASCYVLKNDDEQAVEWYQKAIEHDPKQVTSYVALAEILRTRLKDPARADLVMEQLVQRNQDNAQARLARAKYLQQRGSAEDE